MLEVIRNIKKFGLNKTVEDYKLIIKDYEDKFLLKYSQMDSDMSELIVQECRGLILRKSDLKILNLSFFKFFNSGEINASKIDWSTTRFLLKADGSMISLYFDYTKDTWFASTTGTAEGDGLVNPISGLTNPISGLTFNELFWLTVKDKLRVENLVKGNSYVFELMTPENIVVTPHTDYSVKLLTIRNLETLKELSYDELIVKAKLLNVNLIESIDLNANNFGSVIKKVGELPWHEEGYVLVDENHNRVKIKNPKYVSVHHLASKDSPYAMLTVIKTNELDEFLAVFPHREDELRKLDSNYRKTIDKVTKCWEVLKVLKPKNISSGEKKKFAMNVFKMASEYGCSDFTGLFFNLERGVEESVTGYLSNLNNKKLYEKINK